LEFEESAIHSKSPRSNVPRHVSFISARWAWALLLLLGICATTLTALFAKSHVDGTQQQHFATECERLSKMVSERLADHARLLRGGVALFAASDFVSRDEWRRYSENLNLEQQLPGIQGFGFSLFIPKGQLAEHIRQVRSEGFPDYDVFPEVEREIQSAVIYVEPFSGRNRRAFGYDVMSEPVRRAAGEFARDTGITALSGKVTLVQETTSEAQAGTLMLAAVYKNGMPTGTIDERRAAFYGWVYSAQRMNDFLQRIVAEWHPQGDYSLDFRVFDGREPVASSLLYEYHHDTAEGSEAHEHLTQQKIVEFNGHYWTLLFAKAGIPVFSAAYISVWVILLAGASITFLLLALFRSLSRGAEGLRTSAANYRTLADSGQALIWKARRDSLCDYFNKTWLDFTGRTFEQEFGNGWAEGVHPDDLQRCLAIYTTAFAKREPFSMDYRLRRHDGEFRWLQDDGCPRYDANGRFVGFIGYCLDVTDRKRLETELLTKIEELDGFSYAISHDLKGPLVTIQVFASMIEKELAAGSQANVFHDLSGIKEGAARMLTLVDHLLVLAIAGKVVNAATPVDMKLLVREVLAGLTGLLAEHHVEMSIDDDLGTVHGDFSRISTVVQNLIENAVKFGPTEAPCSVKIGVRQDGDERVFFVGDNGKGIDPREHERVFGLFNRLDTDTAGTGVGLALARRIVQAHGGRIWVESEGLGMGSRFCFTFGTTPEEESSKVLELSRPLA
jgi:PAS domain S-box-containing protein